MTSDIESTFTRLREILRRHAGQYMVNDNESRHFGLEAKPGPATLRAWRGKVRKETIPAAWVSVGKSGVSYHLMGLEGNSSLAGGLSKELKAKLNGKTCFTFKKIDDALLGELDEVTSRALTAFRKAGFVVFDDGPGDD